MVSAVIKVGHLDFEGIGERRIANLIKMLLRLRDISWWCAAVRIVLLELLLLLLLVLQIWPCMDVFPPKPFKAVLNIPCCP